MRKVLSFVLVLAMILGSVSMAFAASPTDVVGKDSEEAVNVLMEFGVVTGYPDGSFKPAGIVTRAEMAAFVIRALGLNPTAPASTQFKDVPATHWSSKYVAYATNLGIIMGRTPTMFDPNATVSYDEAVTMLVRALGYTEASLNGTYPAAYVSKAMALGILGSMPTGTAGANRGDIAKLVFNTLNCAIGKVGTDNIWVISNPVDTMMERLGASAYNDGDAFVVTGDESSIINMYEYQGAYVTAYQNDDGDIIAIKEVKSVFLTGDFDNNISTSAAFSAGSKFDAGTIYDVKATTTSGGVTYFSNRDAVAAYAVTAGTEYVIAAKVSGVKITEVYSVAEWTGAKYASVDSAMLKQISKDDRISVTAKFPLDDNNKIDYKEFILNGVTNLADIKADDIITYYTSGNTITKLQVCDDVVSGVITKMNIAKTKITVNGIVYEMYNTNAFTNAAGDEVKLTLTYGGDVYSVDKITGEANMYAIVEAVELGNDITFGSSAITPQIKLFLADGTEKIFTLDAKEMKDNGVLGLTSGSYVTTGPTIGLTAGSIIKYDLSAAGEVNDMMSLTTGAVSSLTNQKVSVNGVVGGYKLASDVLVFVADGVTTSSALVAEDYSIGSRAGLLDNTITAGIFDLDDNDEICMIVVKSDSTSTDTVYGVVSDSYTHNGIQKFGLVMFVDGNAMTYEADSAYSITTPSALMKVSFNVDGSVDSLTPAAIDYAVSSAGSIEVSNGRLKIAGNDKGLLSDSIVVYVWNSDDQEWNVGNTGDLEDTLGAGESITVYKLDTDNPSEITCVMLYLL